MYEGFYGLTSKPFQLTPDPGFFYASKLHKRAMSYLQYGLSQGEGFIVITGGIGTGKTTIANSLLADIQEDICAAQIVTPKLSPDEVTKMVAHKFGLNVEGKTKSEVLKDLEGYLIQLNEQGKRALLLVDEAQNLPLETIEELRMLSNFQIQGKPLLQSFLLGQEELQPILRAPNMEQFRQRIVASCHLAPLNEEECKRYIEFRLSHAGCEQERLLTDEAHKQVYLFTRGIPRKINTLMDRVLLFGFLEEMPELDHEAVNKVVAEIKDEMFDSEEVHLTADDAPINDRPNQNITVPENSAPAPLKDVHYYKAMLNELVEALDDAISHKIKLTRYIDKILKKKYRTYVRLKSDD